MPLFSQKGKTLKADTVETVDCKDHVRRYRRIDRKTWVKRHSYYIIDVHVRLAYESSRHRWKNRTLEVTFTITSTRDIKDAKAIEYAEKIVASPEYDWFDFYNHRSVIGLETREEHIDEQDMTFLQDLESEEDIIEDEKVIDVKGWGE